VGAILATVVWLRHPATGDEKVAYEGYSWTSLCFGAFPALLRGDLVTGLAVLLGIIALGLAAYSVDIPTWASTGVVSGIWGFVYNDLHRQKLLRAGYQVVSEPLPTPSALR